MKRVIVTGARAPVALHLARMFDAAGWRVVLADTLAQPLARASRACARYVRLPSADSAPEAFGAALAALMVEERPDLVVPTCEEVFYLAWAFERHGLGAALYAPPFAVLARAHSKAAFAADAAALGLHPPPTRVLSSAADVEAVRGQSREMVFKPVWSRFAARVLIRPQASALDGLGATAAAPWVAQSYMPGEELCCYAVAREGRVLGLASYRPAYRAGLGAGIYFEPVDDEQIVLTCETYVAHTKWTGQISFDFKRDAAGLLRVLECNPRATSGVHFYGRGSSLVDAMSAGAAVVPSINRPLMIPAAMWVYGLPSSIGGIGAWWRDMRRGTDALAWPGDRLAVTAQPRALMELAVIARRGGASLIAASTAGIAWDGNEIGAATTSGVEGMRHGS